MDGGWVHSLAKNPTFLSSNYDELLSWMIEIWMKNHIVSNSNWNTLNQFFFQGMTNYVGLTFSVLVTVYHNLQLAMKKTIKIDDTKYQI